MNDPASPRFAVLQPGARLHYGVPAILAAHDMLARLYTDAHGDGSALRLLGWAWPNSLMPKPARRLLGRRLPCSIDRGLVWDQTKAAIGLAVATQLGFHREKALEILDRRLLDVARREAFGGAKAIYTAFINSDIELVRHARAKGIKVVHECMIGPDVGLWLDKERTLFPGVETREPMQQIEAGRARDAAKLTLSDLILVPSDFTRTAVLNLGVDPSRVALVPYGIAERWLSFEPDTEIGRVLFVGSVGLRKGSHHLAAATLRLKERRVPCEIRIVGPYDENAIAKPIFEGPLYLGQVPREEVVTEFRRADVFVLPTICDGSALAHLEALACGVPVITTPNCGAVVRDGVDGFIVPIRDPEAIADRIEQIVTDRGLRDRLSRNARDRAREFTWERYGERLVETLRQHLG